jgi:hypothetical protein
MFIRWTLPNGTHMWHRADFIRSVEKDPDTKLKTIVWIDRAGPKGYMAYNAEESQIDIVEAICVALKTGLPQIVKENASEEAPPRRLIS